jgi:hypothetical protein
MNITLVMAVKKPTKSIREPTSTWSFGFACQNLLFVFCRECKGECCHSLFFQRQRAWSSAAGLRKKKHIGERLESFERGQIMVLSIGAVLFFLDYASSYACLNQ